MAFILQWIDVLWLAIAMAVVHPRQRLIAGGFFIGCMLMMRLLVELMESIGYPHGLIGLMDSAVRMRALIVYSIFYLLYIILLYVSPRGFQAVLLGASISVFFMAALLTTFVMVL